MITPEEIYKSGKTAKGSALIDSGELESSLDYLLKNGVFVQSMEAFAKCDDQEVPMLEFAILGLDGGADWEIHYDPDRSYDLVRKKTTLARRCEHPVMFKIWLDNLPETNMDSR